MFVNTGCSIAESLKTGVNYIPKLHQVFSISQYTYMDTWIFINIWCFIPKICKQDWITHLDYNSTTTTTTHSRISLNFVHKFHWLIMPFFFLCFLYLVFLLLGYVSLSNCNHLSDSSNVKVSICYAILVRVNNPWPDSLCFQFLNVLHCHVFLLKINPVKCNWLL